MSYYTKKSIMMESSKAGVFDILHKCASGRVLAALDSSCSFSPLLASSLFCSISPSALAFAAAVLLMEGIVWFY